MPRSNEIAALNTLTKNRPLSSWLLIACGIWLVGLGLYFMLLRPPLLPEDPRFMGTTLEQVRAAVPGLEGWLKNVFRVMGGFMAGAGALTVFVAAVAMPLRLNGTSWALAISGVLTVVLMSATNWLAGLAMHMAKR